MKSNSVIKRSLGVVLLGLLFTQSALAQTVRSHTRKWKICNLLWAALLMCFLNHAFAIEGLTISVPPTNVVLSWPSDPSESYLIQYRHTLDATDSWTTLADYYPPDYTGLNITYFYDTNIDYGSGDSGGGGSPLSAMSALTASSIQTAPLAIPSDGSGDAVPLSLYPPGFDLSAFLILDPTTSRWVSGASYSAPAASLTTGRVTPLGGPIPLDGGGGGGSTNTAIPGTGFYRVVRDGVHLGGISNDMVLSGVVTIPVELGNNGGQVVSMCMNSDDSPVSSSIQSIPSINALAITLDTTTIPNGTHNIFASARWEDTNGGSWEADSPTFSITTSNEITFENWMPAFGELGNSLLIRATSAHQDTDWNVDIYDSSNQYVVSISGHCTDGNIYAVWDLSDTNGVLHTNDNFFTCKISTPYADPPKPTYKQNDPWPSKGQWVFGVQHAFDSLMDVDMLYEELNGFLGAASGAFGVIPQPNSGNPFAIHFQCRPITSEAATFRCGFS